MIQLKSLLTEAASDTTKPSSDADALYSTISQINEFVDAINKAHESMGKYTSWKSKKFFGQEVPDWPTDPATNKKIALGLIKRINDVIETYHDQIKQMYNT